MANSSVRAERKLPSLRLFLFGYLALALLFTAIFKAVLALHALSDLSALQVHEAAKVEVAGRSLERSIEMASSDLRAIAHMPTVEALIGHQDAASRAQAAQLFRSFAQEKQVYD